MKIKCVILLASYNGEDYIKSQINSILNQKNIDLKLIISDDNSNDNTVKLIQSFNDDRITLLPIIRSTGSASQNFFRLLRDVDFNSFDYISLADQDDIWEFDKLSRSIKKIMDEKVDAYSSNVTAFWDNGRELLLDKSEKQKRFDHLFSSAGPGCTYVFKKGLALNLKRQLIRQEKLTKRIDLHDWLIYTYARENNYKWFVDINVTMKYRQHGNNEFGANSGIIALKDRWSKARNGWYRNQILNISSFCSINNRIVKLLTRNTYIDRLRLLKNLFQYRKKKKEAIFLGLILIVPGFK